MCTCIDTYARKYKYITHQVFISNILSISKKMDISTILFYFSHHPPIFYIFLDVVSFSIQFLVYIYDDLWGILRTKTTHVDFHFQMRFIMKYFWVYCRTNIYTSSCKYLFLVVQVFIPRHASVKISCVEYLYQTDSINFFSIWVLESSESISIKYCKYLHIVIQV